MKLRTASPVVPRLAGGNSLPPGKDAGGRLFKVLKSGYDQIHIRSYVKFAADHGYLNHFVKLQGSINPSWWTEGEAGTGEMNDSYHAKYPERVINTQSARVWFDNVGVATRYIGPISGK